MSRGPFSAKPYGYSLFNLNAFAIAARALTSKDENLWTWRMPDRPEYLALRRTLDADPTVEEVVCNFPVRQPQLWA